MARRIAIITVGFLLLFTVGLWAGGEAEEPSVEEVKLDFSVWTYAVDMIQDNINKFEASYDGEVTVNLIDYGWGEYNSNVIAEFTSRRGGPELLYGSDHWLQQWAEAGWIVPLKEVFPDDEVDALMGDMVGYSVSGMTYNDEVYGLPYYADPYAFMYNTRFYDEAGIDQPPRTWDEVLEHARIIKDQGLVRYPIGFGWSEAEPNNIEIVTALMMSRGDEFFDENFEPLFLGSDSTLVQHIEWVKTALDEDLMDPESLTRDGVADGQSMEAGTQVYGVARASRQAVLNDPGVTDEAGNFEIITMPGPTGDTLGFVRFYAVGKNLPERDQAHKDAAWAFMQYFAGPGPEGDWPVVRRWAVEHGLGFGPLPLFRDPQIREAFGRWTDVDQLEEIARNARARVLSPWYAPWDEYTRTELQRAYLGRVSTEAAVENIARQWEEYRADYED